MSALLACRVGNGTQQEPSTSLFFLFLFFPSLCWPQLTTLDRGALGLCSLHPFLFPVAALARATIVFGQQFLITDGKRGVKALKRALSELKRRLK